MKDVCEYLSAHRDELKKFCSDIGISYDKLSKKPRVFDERQMFYYEPDSAKSAKGLADTEPIKVLLSVTRDGDDLTFEAAPDIGDYL